MSDCLSYRDFAVVEVNTSYVMYSSSIPWNIPRVNCIFFSLSNYSCINRVSQTNPTNLSFLSTDIFTLNTGSNCLIYFLMLLCFSLGEDEDSDAAQEDASARDSEDEAEWDRLQADVKGRDPILDPKSKESHIVHAPYFPEVQTDLNRG